MKKLLSILVLSLLWNGNAFSEIKTFKCERLQTYVDRNGELISSGWGSNHQITLIVRKGTEDDYPYFGKIDVIGKDFEHKYKITQQERYKINAIRHFYIEDEDIKERVGALKKFTKKRKGKLYHISFLNLSRFDKYFSWYKLTINRSQDLYLIDHPSFASNVYSINELYRCKE